MTKPAAEASLRNCKYLLLYLLAVFLISLARLSLLCDGDHSYVDERGWVQASTHVANNLLNMDLDPSSWEFREDKTYGNNNPPLAKIFFALPLVSAAVLYGEALPDVSPGLEIRPYFPELRNRLRWISCVFGALVISMCAIVGLSISNFLGSVCTVLVLLFNPIFTYIASIVVSDIPLSFFLLMPLVASLFFLRATSATQRFGLAALAGASTGWATMVKFNAPLLLFPFFLLMVAVLLVRGNFPKREVVALAFTAVLTSGMALFLANPYFWPEVTHFDRGGLARDIAKVDSITQLAGTELPTGYDAQQALPVLYAITRPIQLPLMYWRWNKFNNAQQGNGLWKGGNNISFFRNLLINGLTLKKVEPLFYLTGLVYILLLARSRAAVRVFLAYAFVFFVAIFATRFADLDRYLLMLYICRMVFTGVGIAVLLNALFSLAPRFLSRTALC